MGTSRVFFTAERIIMRIGLVTSSYPLTPDDTVNAGVFVRDLAKELVLLGNEVYVITPFKYGPVVSDEGIPVTFIKWWGGEKDLASISMRNPKTLFRYATLIFSGILKTIQLTRKLQFDTMLAMWTIPSGLFTWVAKRLFGVPYGVWALGSDIWARHKYPFGQFIVQKILQDAHFRFADGIKLAQDVSEISGYDCQFVPSIRKLDRIPQSIELAPDVLHFLYIGRYEYNKGPDILIDAMRLCVDWGLSAQLHMFGTGSLEQQLRQKTVGYESFITVHGVASPETCVTYMHACDWLIIPSRIESIPLVFSDAVQMNLPILVTDVGDLKNLIEEYNVGLVVPPNDPLELARKMAEIIQVPGRYSHYDFQEMMKKFDIRQSAIICDAHLCKIKRE